MGIDRAGVHRVEADLRHLIEVVVWRYGRDLEARRGWNRALILVTGDGTESEVWPAGIVAVGIVRTGKRLDTMAECFEYDLAGRAGVAVGNRAIRQRHTARKRGRALRRSGPGEGNEFLPRERCRFLKIGRIAYVEVRCLRCHHDAWCVGTCRSRREIRECRGERRCHETLQHEVLLRGSSARECVVRTSRSSALDSERRVPGRGSERKLQFPLQQVGLLFHQLKKLLIFSARQAFPQALFPSYTLPSITP